MINILEAIALFLLFLPRIIIVLIVFSLPVMAVRGVFTRRREREEAKRKARQARKALRDRPSARLRQAGGQAIYRDSGKICGQLSPSHYPRL